MSAIGRIRLDGRRNPNLGLVPSFETQQAIAQIDAEIAALREKGEDATAELRQLEAERAALAA